MSVKAPFKIVDMDDRHRARQSAQVSGCGLSVTLNGNGFGISEDLFDQVYRYGFGEALCRTYDIVDVAYALPIRVYPIAFLLLAAFTPLTLWPVIGLSFVASLLSVLVSMTPAIIACVPVLFFLKLLQNVFVTYGLFTIAFIVALFMSGGKYILLSIVSLAICSILHDWLLPKATRSTKFGDTAALLAMTYFDVKKLKH